MNKEVAIQLQNVSKRFDRIQSLSHVSIQVRSGEIFAVLGPNGAGKTTTLRTILGLLRPDEGQALVFGLNPWADAREVRLQLGVLLENDGLYDRLSAWDNLDFHARIWHLPARVRQERMESLLRPLELWERRNEQVATWSKGMRQKLAIARALLPKRSQTNWITPFLYRSRMASLTVLSGILIRLEMRFAPTNVSQVLKSARSQSAPRTSRCVGDIWISFISTAPNALVAVVDCFG